MLKKISQMRNIKRIVGNGKLSEILKNDAVIKTYDIPEYFSKENIFFITFWIRYKKFGNPWSIGWSYWPLWAIKVIELLDYVNEVLSGN